MYCLGFSDVNGWRLGIGDPTILGWVTVVAYFWAATQCVITARSDFVLDEAGQRKRSQFWPGLALLMFCLGINKQLDLQTFFTVVARGTLRNLGLYDYRRSFQVVFIFVILVVTCLAGLALFWNSRRQLQQRGLAIIGVCAVFAFVVIRASSLHHVDIFLGKQIGGVRWNCIIELSGIAMVGIGALHAARTSSTQINR